MSIVCEERDREEHMHTRTCTRTRTRYFSLTIALCTSEQCVTVSRDKQSTNPVHSLYQQPPAKTAAPEGRENKPSCQRGPTGPAGRNTPQASPAARSVHPPVNYPGASMSRICLLHLSRILGAVKCRPENKLELSLLLGIVFLYRHLHPPIPA